MKLIDAVGIALIIFGVVLTALSYFGVKNKVNYYDIPVTIFYDVPERSYFDGRYIRASLHHSSRQPSERIPTPYRMADWAQCMDGTQVYSTNPQYPTEPPAEPPCVKHGGLRALGPGKRLNEK